jgi:hypothetical protein
MRAPLRQRFILAAIAFLFAGALPPSAADEKPQPNPFTELPFSEWTKQGNIETVRWKTSAFVIGLTSHQRLVARFVMEVDGKALTKRGNHGSIVGLVQVTDAAGRNYRHYASMDLSNLDPEKKSTDIVDYWDAFVLPGDYTVDLALYHSGTGEHNLIQRKLSVTALKNDPLPEAWRNVPTLEFVDPAMPPDKEIYFHPEVQGKLELPLNTRRTVQLQVLADLTPSELFHGSQARYNRYLIAAVPSFKVFSQIQVRNGTLDMAILDLLERRVTFEEGDIKAIDWTSLKKALMTMGVATISVRSLGIREPTPAFLRDELLRRLTPAQSSTGNDPLQIFIVFGSPLGLYSFKGTHDNPVATDCNCRIYYLEYDISWNYDQFSATGNVEKMFSPLHVKSFHVHNPAEVRNALARILNEVSQM